MSAPTTYNIKLSEAEMYALIECLTNLRANYLNDMSIRDAQQHPIFVRACELQLKLAKILNPGHKIPLEAYTSSR